MQSEHIQRELVLLGGGHAHVGVLKSFAMKPLPNTRITLISDVSCAPYSGMLPGHIAGIYTEEQIHIDLWPLSRFAHAQFFLDEAVAIDLKKNQVIIANRPPVYFDILSINTGSVPAKIPGSDEYAIAVKPISHFLAKLDRCLKQLLAETESAASDIVVIGGGAGGVELCLSLKARIEKELVTVGKKHKKLNYHLVFSDEVPLMSHNSGVRKIFKQILLEQKIHLHSKEKIASIDKDHCLCVSGKKIKYSHVFLVTNANPHPLFAESGLQVDVSQFVLVNKYLQSISHPHVFAAGDVATIKNYPRPKSGVYSVRASKPLAKNLRSICANKPLRPYTPQKTSMAMISTGTKHAVASKGWWATQGDWIWVWKDYIDIKFMDKYQKLKSMGEMQGGVFKQLWKHILAFRLLDRDKPVDPTITVSQEQMPCGGCGAKIAAPILQKVMRDMKIAGRSDIIRGLMNPDDAAIVNVPVGKVMLHTVDYFRTFIDDPYLLGKIASLHSLSDIWAMGGEAQNALAICCVPYGHERYTEGVLRQLMQGCTEVLKSANCSLVGGHTTEGHEASFGLVVNGLGEEHKILNKAGLQPGNKLILTQALGTGTILVAHMHYRAPASWVENSIEAMLLSNYNAGKCFAYHNVTACTDITGFGLAGHLLEMLQGATVELELDKIPILRGALESMKEGFYSSMHPKNSLAQRGFLAASKWQNNLRFQILFDPQTSGGLLASVSENKVKQVLDDLKNLGYNQASVIGTVLEPAEHSYVQIA